MKDGKFLERAVLGDTHYELRRERMEELKRKYNVPTFTGFALNEKMQPWKDPTKPGKPFAEELRTNLAKILIAKGVLKDKRGVIDEAEEQKLKYFTSVGCAPLDDYSGIDAYFKLSLPTGERIVTIDVSLKNKPETGDLLRSDIFILLTDDISKDDKTWRQVMNGNMAKGIKSIPLQLAEKLISPEPLQMEKPGAMQKMVKTEPIKSDDEY